MRKSLITAASFLLMAAPAFAQSISTDTTITRERTESVAPVIVPVPAPAPAVGGTYESRSSVTHSGAGGESRTDKKSDTYIGADGSVRKDEVIQHEEQR